VFHVNVAGVFATIQAFYPLLKVRPPGSCQTGRASMDHWLYGHHRALLSTSPRLSATGCMPC